MGQVPLSLYNMQIVYFLSFVPIIHEAFHLFSNGCFLVVRLKKYTSLSKVTVGTFNF